MKRDISRYVYKCQNKTVSGLPPCAQRHASFSVSTQPTLQSDLTDEIIEENINGHTLMEVGEVTLYKL